jgi:hypothetical protein
MCPVEPFYVSTLEAQVRREQVLAAEKVVAEIVVEIS